MTLRRIAVALVAINSILIVMVLLPIRSVFAQPNIEPVAKVLRAHSLEIVDDQGRTRAQIVIAPASVKDNVAYPETVLFRLIDPEGQPTVKMGASLEGSALDMLGGPDDKGWYGMQILSDAGHASIKLVTKDSRELLMQP